jgi:hypothetical protein
MQHALLLYLLYLYVKGNFKNIIFLLHVHSAMTYGLIYYVHVRNAACASFVL